jgi:hypothetical protein
MELFQFQCRDCFTHKKRCSPQKRFAVAHYTLSKNALFTAIDDMLTHLLKPDQVDIKILCLICHNFFSTICRMSNINLYLLLISAYNLTNCQIFIHACIVIRYERIHKAGSGIQVFTCQPQRGWRTYQQDHRYFAVFAGAYKHDSCG